MTYLSASLDPRIPTWDSHDYWWSAKNIPVYQIRHFAWYLSSFFHISTSNNPIFGREVVVSNCHWTFRKTAGKNILGSIKGKTKGLFFSLNYVQSHFDFFWLLSVKLTQIMPMIRFTTFYMAPLMNNYQ